MGRKALQPRAARGAAMVEFVVIATFVLVPLYLAVQAIGKFADVRSSVNNAARYAAWERTVWSSDTTSEFAKRNQMNQKSDANIRNEMRVRLLNDRQAGFKYTNNDKNLATFANGTDPLWRDTAGNALVSDPSRMTLGMTQEKPAKDLLGGAIALINKISVPSITGTLAPPVPTDALAVADVQLVKVGETSPVYQRLWSKSAGLPSDWVGLDFAAKGAILSNTWAANSSQGTKNMVTASVPTANGLGTAVEVATKAVMLAWDPTLVPRLDMGKIAVDVVPPDRLK